MDKKGKIVLITALFLMGILLISLTIAKPGTRGKPMCMDKIDNDGDGYTDWPSDPGCDSKQDRSELNADVECDDGNDNDGDNDIDYNDAGCTGPTDNDETNCGDSVCEGGEVCDVCVADCGTCDSCSDTDGGIVILVQGTVSGNYSGQPYSYDDYCLDGLNLVEYYCGSTRAYNMTLSCSGNETTNCSSGACV